MLKLTAALACIVYLAWGLWEQAGEIKKLRRMAARYKEKP